MADLVFQIFSMSLVILFFVSIGLLINSLVKNQKYKNHSNTAIEQKLDKIIELLEKNNNDKN
ncbi:DUF4083 family protein [Bacillus methanolicus]|uniref:DUF4083 family protein n=1 Tax=Bacillus methanolicus TaxID=1471 RepID=UPI0023800533|nr:DUF4083 family protein [Bacillus methanolicus]